MQYIYWVKFRDLKQPNKFVWNTLQDQLEDLKKYTQVYGWIEWMHRD